MVNHKNTLSVLLILGLILAGCNMPESGRLAFGDEEAGAPVQSAPNPAPPVPGRPPVLDLNGTWQGTMFDAISGVTFNTRLVITQEAGSSEFSGSIEWTDPNRPDFYETYLIAGTLAGNTFQFQNSGGEEIMHYFWGTVDGNLMNAQVSVTCYDCGDAFGTILVSR